MKRKPRRIVKDKPRPLGAVSGAMIDKAIRPCPHGQIYYCGACREMDGKHPWQTRKMNKALSVKPHTLPWKYQEDADAYTHIIRGTLNELLFSFGQDSSGQAEADARFTVRAVNAYAGLVEMFRALVRLEALGSKHMSKTSDIVQHARVALRAAGLAA